MLQHCINCVLDSHYGLVLYQVKDVFLVRSGDVNHEFVLVLVVSTAKLLPLIDVLCSERWNLLAFKLKDILIVSCEWNIVKNLFKEIRIGSYVLRPWVGFQIIKCLMRELFLALRVYFLDGFNSVSGLYVVRILINVFGGKFTIIEIVNDLQNSIIV